MSQETRRAKIIHLPADPSLTQEQIAQVVGCSRKTVQRTAAEIKADVQGVDGKLEEYQRLLSKKLPIKDRVDLYDRIARKAESNPFAAMRALERADELDGILTAKDRNREPEAPGPQQAVFVMPPGTNVQVNVWNKQEVKQVSKEIDVTPEAKEEDGK